MMGPDAFQSWAGVGSYGGLACSLLAACGVAIFALARHRGSSRQLANAVLICLLSASLSLLPIWWKQTQLDFYGPAVSPLSVTFWLVWIALCGWSLPIGVFASYTFLAAAQPTQGQSIPGQSAGTTFASLDDSGRHIEPLGPGQAWGRLIPLDGPLTHQPVLLTHQLTLLGREIDNDVVINDERTSRHHAEIHWDRGHVELIDRASMNGTRINHQSVRRRTPLQHGDTLDLGAQSFRFELIEREQEPKALADVETRKVARLEAPERSPVNEPLILVGRSAPVDGKRWELFDAVVSIGRDESRQICLPHESVSRLHAQIVRQPAGYFVTDMQSRNGTLLNRQRLDTPANLLTGDVLTLGEVTVACESVPRPERAPAPPTVAITYEAGAEEDVRAVKREVEEEMVFFQRQAPSSRDERARFAPPGLAPAEKSEQRDAE